MPFTLVTGVMERMIAANDSSESGSEPVVETKSRRSLSSRSTWKCIVEVVM
jgi:hypothetical protein